MRTTLTRFGLTALLLTLTAWNARALTVQIQLTPENVKSQNYTFTIAATDRDDLKQFEITVTPKKDKLSPGLLARVHLSDGKKNYAIVPVEEKRDGNKVTYWFRVAPYLLAHTRFEFDVLSGIEQKDANGQTHFIAEPGTLEYWFTAEDFVPKKAAAKPARKRSNITFGLGNPF